MSDAFLVKIFKSDKEDRLAVALAVGLHAYAININDKGFTVLHQLEWDKAVKVCAEFSLCHVDEKKKAFRAHSATDVTSVVSSMVKNKKLSRHFNQAMGRILSDSVPMTGVVSEEDATEVEVDFELSELDKLLLEQPSDSNEGWGTF